MTIEWLKLEWPGVWSINAPPPALLHTKRFIMNLAYVSRDLFHPMAVTISIACG